MTYISGLDSLLRASVADPTFPQLRTFVCVARTGSFAQAAALLEISQPAVSEQIRTLEDRLGRRLFERRRGTTPMLTPDGDEALETVEQILEAYDSLFLRGLKSLVKTTIRISAGPFLREHYFRLLLPRLYRENPEVEFDLRSVGSPTEAEDLLQSGELDLAIYSLPSDESIPRSARAICDLPVVMVAPPGTRARLAAGECTLNDFQYIFPTHRDVGTRWARKCLRDLQLAPRFEPRFIEFIDALAEMVENGQGLGYITEQAVAGRIAAGRLEVLDLPVVRVRRVISRSPAISEKGRAIESFLCETLAMSLEDLRERFGESQPR